MEEMAPLEIGLVVLLIAVEFGACLLPKAFSRIAKRYHGYATAKVTHDRHLSQP